MSCDSSKTVSLVSSLVGWIERLIRNRDEGRKFLWKVGEYLPRLHGAIYHNTAILSLCERQISTYLNIMINLYIN